MRTPKHQREPKALTVSVEDAAIQLGIGRSLAYELVRQGVIPSVPLGGRIVVPKSAITRLLDEALTSGTDGRKSS